MSRYPPQNGLADGTTGCSRRSCGEAAIVSLVPEYAPRTNCAIPFLTNGLPQCRNAYRRRSPDGYAPVGGPRFHAGRRAKLSDRPSVSSGGFRSRAALLPVQRDGAHGRGT